jgi:hypothetical protein
VLHLTIVAGHPIGPSRNRHRDVRHGLPLLAFENTPDGLDRHIEASRHVAIGMVQPRGLGEHFIQFTGQPRPIVVEGLRLDLARQMGTIRLAPSFDGILQASQG